MPGSGFVFTGRSGCTLPMLIMLNLLFGKLIFNSTRLWLGIEAVLVLLLVIKIQIFMRKIHAHLKSAGQGWPEDRADRSGERSNRGRVIDVEGEVVEEKQKLP